MNVVNYCVNKENTSDIKFVAKVFRVLSLNLVLVSKCWTNIFPLHLLWTRTNLTGFGGSLQSNVSYVYSICH